MAAKTYQAGTKLAVAAKVKWTNLPAYMTNVGKRYTHTHTHTLKFMILMKLLGDPMAIWWLLNSQISF